MNKSIRPWIQRAIMPALALATISLLIAGCPTPGGGETTLSGAKAITAFSFVSPAATETINENAKTIAVAVPYGTDVTALVATFTTTGSSVKVGSTVPVSGTTANNFTTPVIYTVTAADGSKEISDEVEMDHRGFGNRPVDRAASLTTANCGIPTTPTPKAIFAKWKVGAIRVVRTPFLRVSLMKGQQEGLYSVRGLLSNAIKGNF